MLHSGKKKSPLSVFLHTLHEEVWNPQSVEKISCPVLFLTMILLQFEEVKDVCMPWLKVHCKGAFALAPTLINIPCSVIEDTQHRHEPIAVSVGATNVRPFGT